VDFVVWCALKWIRDNGWIEHEVVVVVGLNNVLYSRCPQSSRGTIIS
jgi:hypothetical protein